MPRQSIDTERVQSTASRLRTVNNNISRAFAAVKKKGDRLESNWRSPAGAAAATLMHQILQGGAAREAVLENYIAMLEQQVNPGYASAETVNTKLADQFK